ncbi:MAG TPA: hypothetical protein VII67_05090 [Acidimicrobiales bacterium]
MTTQVFGAEGQYSLTLGLFSFAPLTKWAPIVPSFEASVDLSTDSAAFSLGCFADEQRRVL